MYYLKRYVSGSAKQAIGGLFLQNSSEAYEQADERFGQPFIVTKAYRDKLQEWPKIGAKDHKGLREFADFFIETAMQTIKYLTILNDHMENQKLLAKLPDRFTSQTNREATRERKEQKRYPAFKTFTAFINAEADLASNPISSCNAVACVAGVKRGRGRGNLGARGRKERNACKDAIVFSIFHAQILSVKIVIGQN